MSASMSTHGRATDTPFAPHPLNEGAKPQAARIAEGAHRASTAHLLTAASQTARALVEMAVLAMLVLNIWIWAGVLGGRI